MLFNSIEFLIFFPVVTLIYFALPQKIKWIWLLFASYYFYMCWNVRYALLMALSTLITYLSGIFILLAGRQKDEKKRNILRKLTVAVSFISNLAILFFFKYFNFAFETLSSLFAQFNITFSAPRFDVILPVGISFYTFQALSYTIDVYRGEVKCEKNFFRYALFVSFFPQLVAGPIERSKNLLVQMHEEHHFDSKRARRGLLLMLWGFFLKLVIADRAAIAVNTVYNDYTAYSGGHIAFATILFALQIYCDFASYSDIARGAAEVMGFRLMKNFAEPYFSKSIAEFWRRWHISLSQWFRDCLYIPLGGNRKGKKRKCLNIMIVFLASGLWHGANLTFVIWGFLHGAYQVIGIITKGAREKITSFLHINRASKIYQLFQMLFTFLLVCFGWIFFRANSLADAFGMIEKLFNDFGLNAISLTSLGLSTLEIAILAIATASLIAVSCLARAKKDICQAFMNRNIAVRYALVLAVIAIVLIFGIWGPGFSESQFIYFQF